MKQLILALIAVSLFIFGLPKENNAAIQVKVEPNAGIYYFTDLDSSSVGSGISLTVAKEVGKVQADDSFLGLKVGINFVNPEVDSIGNNRASSCTTITEKIKYRTKSTMTCNLIPVEDTVHLTNFNISWIAETEYNETVSMGFEMGVDVWSSNLSSSDLGVRFGGNAAYKIRDNLSLKAGGVFSGLAEADIHGQEVDISNAYFSFGGEWKF